MQLVSQLTLLQPDLWDLVTGASLQFTKPFDLPSAASPLLFAGGRAKWLATTHGRALTDLYPWEIWSERTLPRTYKQGLLASSTSMIGSIKMAWRSLRYLPVALAPHRGLNRRSGFPDLLVHPEAACYTEPKFGPEISQNDQSQTTLDPCFVTLKDPYKRFTSECIHMPEGADLEQVASRLDGLVIDQCTIRCSITLPPETCKSTLKEMKWYSTPK